MEDRRLHQLKMLKLKSRLPQKTTVAHFELWDTQAPTPCDCILTRHTFNRGGFLMGNQALIRPTKFSGLVAWLLKQGQPGIFKF